GVPGDRAVVLPGRTACGAHGGRAGGGQYQKGKDSRQSGHGTSPLGNSVGLAFGPGSLTGTTHEPAESSVGRVRLPRAGGRRGSVRFAKVYGLAELCEKRVELFGRSCRLVRSPNGRLSERPLTVRRRGGKLAA